MSRPSRCTLALGALLALLTPLSSLAEPVSYSGIYPHLAMFNREGECGTGAVVPWAGRLWAITYGPHKPQGSTDKLYEISPKLEQTIRPESVGGTPADRLIHRESQQLVLGPYLIDEKGGVRTVTPQMMFGRLTGAARHLVDPAHKVYVATMEEGIYEVDVHSLEVKTLWADQAVKEGRHSGLPGYHGKGLYSGQGVLVYANNGDHSKEAVSGPNATSGILAEWDGQSEAWKIIRRNQFTDVTGPGGIAGSEHPETDPIWAIGWDYRSLLLEVRENGEWQTFRLPKASHTYDGGHGWHTEWPRIREIGEKDLLMTMHGTFWRFPASFSAAHSAGIAPRSTFLKVTGDFCRWGDRLVFGCDDTAKDQFTNKRKAKGDLAGPAQSQSNLWFLRPEELDALGPVTGAGAVWLHDRVKAGEPSDPFLFGGYTRRGLHLATGTEEPVTITIETNPGDGTWSVLRKVPVTRYTWLEFTPQETGAWVRLRADRALENALAVFSYRNADPRGTTPAPALFSQLANAETSADDAGTLLAGGEERHELAYAATQMADGRVTGEGRYELTLEKGSLELRPAGDAAALAKLKRETAVPSDVLKIEASSVLYVDDLGQRWRLPRGDAAFDRTPAVPLRVCREVSTERDCFQAHGTFYELPAVTSGGFAKVRPISSHHFLITDYASWRGLLVLSGVTHESGKSNPHLILSRDDKAGLWVGAFDDLWQLGKAVGHGGPWLKTAVKAGEVSDPYLMRGFDQKRLELTQRSEHPVTFTMEVDPFGEGDWQPYQTFHAVPGETTRFSFPEAFAAYWVRFRADAECEASTTLTYE